MKQAEFDLLSDEDAFTLCNKGAVGTPDIGKTQASHNFDIT